MSQDVTTFIFNGRQLTEREIRFYKNHQCIACGTKMIIAKSEDRTLECYDCQRSRTKLSHPTDGPDYGPCRASMYHEYQRRMGYVRK